MICCDKDDEPDRVPLLLLLLPRTTESLDLHLFSDENDVTNNSTFPAELDDDDGVTNLLALRTPLLLLALSFLRCTPDAECDAECSLFGVAIDVDDIAELFNDDVNEALVDLFVQNSNTADGNFLGAVVIDFLLQQAGLVPVTDDDDVEGTVTGVVLVTPDVGEGGIR